MTDPFLATLVWRHYERQYCLSQYFYYGLLRTVQTQCQLQVNRSFQLAGKEHHNVL